MSLKTADDVFVDYCGRRRGILRALSQDVDRFYSQCGPEKENLCLYGYSDGTWEVTLPCDEVPPELPEPALGINFARDGMKKSEWLSLVAVHSDSWLMAIAFFNGARLDANGRRQLFNDINTLPTCYEIVSGRVTMSNKPPGVAGNINGDAGGHLKRGGSSGGEGHPSAKRSRAGYGPAGTGRVKEEDEDDEEEDDEEEEAYEGSDPCPNCGRLYRTGEFWIQCDACDRWFDGKCVSMTPQKAERNSEWKCPFCART